MYIGKQWQDLVGGDDVTEFKGLSRLAGLQVLSLEFQMSSLVFESQAPQHSVPVLVGLSNIKDLGLQELRAAMWDRIRNPSKFPWTLERNVAMEKELRARLLGVWR